MKYLVITFYYPGHLLFESDYFVGTTSYTIASIRPVIIYALFSCPIQEAIARGLLQTTFYQAHFGSETEKKWASIILSNLLFMFLHIHISVVTAVSVFLPGIMWGLLYHKHKSLVSPTISHIFCGLYIFLILGVTSFSFF